MEAKRALPEELKAGGSFTKNRFREIMTSRYGMTEPQINYDLQKRLKEGELIRSGWGNFTVPQKRIYTHIYSEAAKGIAEDLNKDYYELSFRIFELVQLNVFMNHQIAHNSIFVSVENDLVSFVFDSLWRKYPGKVLLKPKAEMYYRYLHDDEIIVNRLPSESPKGLAEPWESRIEKILVDVFTDKLISEIIPEGEKSRILTGAYADYLIDEDTMVRYAKRKGAERKLMKALQEYGETDLS